MTRHLIPLVLLLTLLMVPACSDDPAAPAGDDGTRADGTLVPGGDDFALSLEFAGGPDGRVRGPFLLSGKNLHYSDLLGALIVELTVTNMGRETYPEPVTIRFHRLIPESTRILNSPDDSPYFTFEFANDDARWTPGEESLPLEVMFSAPLGQSVGFSAEIGVSVNPGAFIAGFAWLDGNYDGIMDPDEPMLPGVTLRATDGSMEEILRQVTTGEDGRFVFRDLDPGTWEIAVVEHPIGLMNTTPAVIHVLLTRYPGSGGGFSQANFGFARSEEPPPGPVLTVIGDSLGTMVGVRGENRFPHSVSSIFTPRFRWSARPGAPGIEIASYRHGMNVQNPDDPDDPGWLVAPGLGAENLSFASRTPLGSGMHVFLIESRDTEDNLTRVFVEMSVHD